MTSRRTWLDNFFGPAVIRIGGVELPERSAIGLSGTGVAATDDAVNDQTNLVISGGGNTWRTALDFDFSAQSTQSLATDGTYTIGGKVWTKRSSSADFDGQPMRVTSGTGLENHPGHASNYDRYNANVFAPLLSLPLADIVPSFRRHMGVRVWIYISADSAGVQYENTIFGVEAGNAEVTHVALRGHGVVGHPGFNGQYACVNVNPPFFGKGVTLADSNRVVVLEVPSLGLPVMRLAYGAWASGWPAESDLTDALTLPNSNAGTALDISPLTEATARILPRRDDLQQHVGVHLDDPQRPRGLPGLRRA